MKFVSKLNHYRVTLRPGLPGNPIMAIPPTQGVHALFEAGQFFTDDEEVIALLKKNKLHGVTYFSVEDDAAPDPFSKDRKQSEPAHMIMEMGQGEKAGRMVTPPAPTAQGVAIKEAAEALLKQLMPAIVEKVRAEVRAEQETQAPAVSEDTSDDTKAAKAKNKKAVAEASEPEKVTSEAK